MTHIRLHILLSPSKGLIVFRIIFFLFFALSNFYEIQNSVQIMIDLIEQRLAVDFIFARMIKYNRLWILSQFRSIDDATLNEFTPNCLGIRIRSALVNLGGICGLRCEENATEWNWNANEMTSSRECETIVTDIYIEIWLIGTWGNQTYITFQKSTSSSIRMHWSMNVLKFLFASILKWLIMMTTVDWFNLPQFVHALIVPRLSIEMINMPKYIQIWK